MYKVNIIGCGRLGSTISYLIAKTKLATIEGVCNSTAQSSENAVKFIGQGKACTKLEDLPPADIYIITTPDGLIEKTCNNLVAYLKNIKRGSLFLHCSGSYSSDVLQQAKTYLDCKTVSIHPIKSFADPKQNINNFDGTYCAYEGDKEGCLVVCELFTAMGGKLFEINKNKKSIYHVGGVFAANYLVALFNMAEQCYLESGISTDTTHDIVLSMMSNTLNNLKKLTPQQALTGPMQRGDIDTIKKHIHALEETSLSEAYRVMGKATLALTNHVSEKKTELLTILEDKESQEPAPEKLGLFM